MIDIIILTISIICIFSARPIIDYLRRDKWINIKSVDGSNIKIKTQGYITKK